jgi:hypothetical protein
MPARARDFRRRQGGCRCDVDADKDGSKIEDARLKITGRAAPITSLIFNL